MPAGTSSWRAGRWWARARLPLILAAVSVGFLATTGRQGGTGGPATGRPLLWQAKVGEFVHKVRAIGSLRAGELTGVTSPLSGLLITARAPEGAAVRQGDLIFQLDRSELEEQVLQTRTDLVPAEASLAAANAGLKKTKLATEEAVREAEAKLRVAEARLALQEQKPLPADRAIAEADLEEATARFTYADYWFETTRELFAEGVVSQSDLDLAVLSQHTAASDMRHAQKVLAETLKGAEPADLEEARAALAEAQMAVQVARETGPKRLLQATAAVESEGRKVQQLRDKLTQLQADLEKTEIRAEHDGTLFAHEGERVDVGDQTWRGLILADLARPSSLIFHVRVRECDSRLVEEGQPAAIFLIAMPRRPLEGVVTKVGKVLAEGEETPGMPCLDVEIGLKGDVAGIRPAMRGHVEIEVGRVREAVVLPQCTLSENRVRALTDRGLEERQVEILASNGTHVAIGSGVRAGEWVALWAQE